MIFVTGDLHGEIDRFKEKGFGRIKKRDYLVVCGDFGFVWNNSEQEKKNLKWLSKRRYTIAFVEGGNDNLQLLCEYPVVDFCGGKARQIEKNIFQLMRGQIYMMNEKKIFACGGGEPLDKDIIRELGKTHEGDLPTPAELEKAYKNIIDNNFEVDYIFTHEISGKIKMALMPEANHANHLNLFFEELEKRVSFKGWYFGCYHSDKRIPPKHHALFKQVIKVEG